jgi:peptidoglycan/xylan/chitin deacetylase (PgdA/CDA1 family)
MEILRRDVIILAYHHVAEPPPGTPIRGLYVRPADFAWQVDWLLARGARFCTLRDLVARPEALTGPGVPVVLTFDDGYRDVHREAFPVLRARALPAVVFPVVGDLGRSGVVWPGSADRTPADLLGQAEAREMAAAGVEFGSHLMDHVDALRLSPEALRAQLTGSKLALERLLGTEVVSLAYPFGAHDAAVVEAAARAGYRCAVTTERGVNLGAPMLRLRRIPVKGTRWYHRWEFRRALAPRLTEAFRAGR